MLWLESGDHYAWLHEEMVRLLMFGRAAGRPGGGAWSLDFHGRPDKSVPQEPYHVARVAHAMAVGTLAGIPGCRPVLVAAIDGLRGNLADQSSGGWFHQVADGGVLENRKSTYDQVHVLMAASSARLAKIAGAEELYEQAAHLVGGVLFNKEVGVLWDGFDADFVTPDPYLGANANMHGVEAMLAAFDVSGEPAWLDRAHRVTRFFVSQALAHEGRLPEHYDPTGAPQLDYNRDRPGDRFKPFGVTMGHLLEWSRLILQLEAALDAVQPGEADGLLGAAQILFARALHDGWSADGKPGFVYTTDFEGRPVVRQRLWWVISEAVGAAYALWLRTGDTDYARRYEQWWDVIADGFIDRDRGSWHHALTTDGEPDTSIWTGKPDLYHTVLSTVVPRLPLYPGTVKAIADGHLRR